MRRVSQGTVPLDFRIRRIRLPSSQCQPIRPQKISPFFFFSDFHTGDNLDLGNAVGVTEDDTDLRRGSTLSGELADLVDDLVGGGLQPRGGGAGVGESGGRNALALAVKSAHLVCLAAAAAAVVVMLRMVSSRLGRAPWEKFERVRRKAVCVDR